MDEKSRSGAPAGWLPLAMVLLIVVGLVVGGTVSYHCASGRGSFARAVLSR